MSKEYLEALERLKENSYYVDDKNMKEDYNIIKQALLELKAIKEANPSEALRYVNGKIADLEDDLQHYTMVEKDKCREFYIREDLKQFTNIKQALLKAQEQEKVLEIAFKKRIDLESFYSSFVENDYDYNFYEKRYGTYGKYELTEEEFELLKSYFEKNIQKCMFNSQKMRF